MSIRFQASHKPPIDIAAVSAAALRSLPDLLADWLPSGRREGHEYVVRNPNRADAKPGSFKINIVSGRWSDFATGDEGGDAVSLFAFLKGTSQVEAARAVADRLGMGRTLAEIATLAEVGTKSDAKDRLDEWRPIVPVPVDAPKIGNDLPKRLAPAGLSLVKGYRYEGSDGETLGHIARYEGVVDGKPAKAFFPFTFCEGSGGRREWRVKGFPSPRPLYGLQWLAQRPADPVIVTEGEKSAQAAYKLFPTHVSVTSSGGSKAAKYADWTPLVGRNVVVWPDVDDAGTKYAADVVEALMLVGAKSIAVVKLPSGLPEGWDLADDLPAGMTVADLLRLLVTPKAAAPEGPLPLFPPLPPAEPFPVDALGPTLARATSAIANKVQVPVAMAAQSVLAAAALAAQAHADIMLPYGQTRPLSLFFVTVAASGDRKSSADNEALWPVTKREKTLREEHVEEMKDWRAARDAWGGEHKKIETDKKLGYSERKDALAMLGDEPAKPLAPFLTTGDLTLEGLTKNWINAHPALGIFTAEAGVFTNGHGMSDDNRLRTAAMLSEVWDGKPVKRVRALDGVTILPGRRLSMHLMVQPGAAAGFLGNSTLKDQGLLSRVLAAAPESLAGTRLHRAVDPADDHAIRSYGARILALLEAPRQPSRGWRTNWIRPPCGSTPRLPPPSPASPTTSSARWDRPMGSSRSVTSPRKPRSTPHVSPECWRSWPMCALPASA